MCLVNELVLTCLVPLKYAKAQSNLIILSRVIEYSTYYYYYNYTRVWIGFLGNQSAGLRTGDRARPRVADRGALYGGILPNTDMYLNKQLRTMFQGWSRMNNPKAKVLTTAPMDAWHLGVMSFTVSLGNQVTSSSIETLLLHVGLCKVEPNTSVATGGISLENLNLNKSMCAEMFGGELDITEEPEGEKSQVRQHRDWLHELQDRDMDILQ